MARQQLRKGVIQNARGLVLAFSLAICVAVPAVLTIQAQAQTPAVPSAADLLQLGRSGQTNSNGVNQAPQPDVILQPTAQGPIGARLPASQVEQLYSFKAGTPLQQFGYDLLGAGRAVTVPQNGAVQDEYLMGAGDEVVVSLRGQENSELRAYVDRNGQVVLPRLNPISAIGRTFGSFRADLQAAVHRAYVATEAFVSIGRVRQITVSVAGEVNDPGQRIVTGLSSPLDAILVSGGIRKVGSLRNIKLVRGGRVYPIDLYSVLMDRGASSLMRLADGDRILVSPLGRTVAVSGYVRRPGIYELPAGQTTISASQLLALASGPALRGTYSETVQRIDANGKGQFVDVTNEPRALVRDGEILSLQVSVNISLGRIEIVGAVRAPGAYSLEKYKTLHDLLPSSEALMPGAYVLFGVIDRIDPATLAHTAIPFSPLRVVQGKENMTLINDDSVHILTPDAMRYILSLGNQRPEPGVAIGSMAGQGLLPTAGSNALMINPSNPATAGSGTAGAGAAQNCAGPSGASQACYGQPGMVGQNCAGPSGVGQPCYGQVGMGQSGVGQNCAGPSGVSQQCFGPAAMGQAGMGQTCAGPSGVSQPCIGQSGMGQTGGGQTSMFQPCGSQGGPGCVGQGGGTGLGTGLSSSMEVVPAAVAMGGFANADFAVFGNRLNEYRVTIQGAVHVPGTYLVAPGTTLAEAVIAARGLDSDVDLSNFTLTSTVFDNASGSSSTLRKSYSATEAQLSQIVVRPFDRVEFQHIYSDRQNNAVTINGEVRNPGSYSVLHGEHLSSLIRRAGGFTNQAYPYGAIFTRWSVAAMERESHLHEADEVQQQLLLGMTRIGTEKISPDAFGPLQGFVRDLRTIPAIGRISVPVDPAILAAHPNLDVLLEAGDSLYIPQRPSTIAVFGQVLHPGSFPYVSGRSFKDYLNLAGGVTQSANEGMIYIVLPDGSARKAETSWLSLNWSQLPPGSTIYVPRDLQPFDLRQTVLDFTQVFSQFAISIASVAVLAKQ